MIKDWAATSALEKMGLGDDFSVRALSLQRGAYSPPNDTAEGTCRGFPAICFVLVAEYVELPRIIAAGRRERSQ